MEQFLFTFALRDFLRMKRLAIWILVVIGIAALSKGLVMVTRQSDMVQAYLNMADLFVFRILALVCAISSTAVISAEVEQKTIVYLLTRPIPRPKLILMRTLAAVVSSMLIGSLLCLSLAAALMGPSGIIHNYVLRDLLGIAVGSFFYTSFFVLLSLWINKSMIVNLLYAFGWEWIAGSMPGDMKMLSIEHYLETLSHRPSSMSGLPIQDAINSLSASTLTSPTAWLVSVVAIAAFLYISGLWFSTHEYLPREDIE